MPSNESIVRQLYADAEGPAPDFDRFVAAFAADGYMLDVPHDTKLQGAAIGASLASLLAAFPDLHRRLLQVDVTQDAVIVELRIQGTHLGPLGDLAPTGKKIDARCCDVFRLQDGKVTAFHCYNMPTIMQQQLAS